ncbi:hypothetical protein EV175_005391, partial [Coemansia sp. RSA 1933]
MKFALVVSGFVGFMGMVHAGAGTPTAEPTMHDIMHDADAIEKRHYITITDSYFSTVTEQAQATAEPDVNSNGNANNNNIVINFAAPTSTSSQDDTDTQENNNITNSNDSSEGNALMYAMMGGGMQTGMMQSLNPFAYMFSGMQGSSGMEYMQMMQYMEQMQ